MQSELEKIRIRKGGLLYPEDVVEAARSKNSPLHDHFDWNDGIAAHNWRLEQARRIIRVFVNVVPSGKTTLESRVFVALSVDRPQGGYRLLTDVLNNDMLRKSLLKDAFDDMERFQRKYSVLNELAAVFKAMDRVSSTGKERTLVAR